MNYRHMSLLFALFFLSVVLHAQKPNSYQEKTLAELAKRILSNDKAFVVVDVRSPGEYHDTSQFQTANIGRLVGAKNLNLQDLRKNPGLVHQFDEFKDKDLYVICSHSYRSRAASNIFLSQGFTKVINVKGGMSEWFRNYDQLIPFAAARESHAKYSNISPAEAFRLLSTSNPVFIRITATGGNSFDSMFSKYYSYYPTVTKARLFDYTDSSSILNYAKSAGENDIIVWSDGPLGSTMATWIYDQGVKKVHTLIGKCDGLYDYLLNYHPLENLSRYFTDQQNIHFITPLVACRMMQQQGNAVVVDMRQDSVFNKVVHGTKLDYYRLKGAVNFPYTNTAKDFESIFRDKQKVYFLVSPSMTDGLELAGHLAAAGYKIYWIEGGNERWEWYTNNVPEFTCGDQLILATGQ